MHRSLRPLLPSLVPGLAAVSLMLVWAAHDGGYDADTWYWGALVCCGLLVGSRLYGVSRRRPLPRAGLLALGAFGAYLAWSYLSIAWAQSPGDALTGSNRTLLYFLLFALMLSLEWTPESALLVLCVFVVGVGCIGIVVLLRLASGDHVGRMLIDGRLVTPTGYLNSTAALFTLNALTAIGLSVRRELPATVRGLLVGLACAGLQLGLIVQSRGWLFTLPLVALLAIIVVSDRLRVVLMAAVAIVPALIPLHRLLAVYKDSAGPGLQHAAMRAGHAALIASAAAFLVAALIVYFERVASPGPLSVRRRRVIGTALSVLAIIAVLAAGVGATKGHPGRFIARQWRGFSHTQVFYSKGSHFADVGSGRYDFWRVALDAFISRPVGGLGQDNFADYYVRHRHTSEEPSWTHSLEMRLLAHTGVVGIGLFAVFIVTAIAAALRARRGRAGPSRGLAGIALLPLVVWLIHGSVDWFWEVPALTGPALGFLGMAGALAPREAASPVGHRFRATPRATTAVTGGLLAAAVVVLGFPYLSVREVSAASDVRTSNPTQALSDLSSAANLDPLAAEPGRLGGTIALQTGRVDQAQQRFRQAISREPGGWFAWFGAGLAASTLGDAATAKRDFQVAYSINSRQPAIKEALDRVLSTRPLTPNQALRLLVLAQ